MSLSNDELTKKKIERKIISKKTKVKIIKFVVLVGIVIALPILALSCCKGTTKMDADKCAELALEYLEEKYQTEFEVLDSGEKAKFIGLAGYAEVIVSNKYKDKENRYAVIVYPDGSLDDDKDGYYDSYKIVSDTYMCCLMQDYAKKEVNKLLIDAGLTKFINSVGIEEMVEISGFSGFSKAFPVQTEEKFSLNDILKNHKISIHCYLKIPESEYSDMLQNNITKSIQPLLSSDDLITFNTEIYNDEYYNEIEESNKKNIEYNAGMGDKSIYFSVENEEDKDEYK